MLKKILSYPFKCMGLATQQDIVAQYETQLLSTSGYFSLWEPHARKHSNRALVELFFGIALTTKPDLFIEAGAKMAEASRRARRMLPDAKVVAFEASPENYNRFSVEFPFKDENIDYLHYALSNKTGTITFNMQAKIDGVETRKNLGNNSILKRKRKGVEYNEVTVPSMRLDDYFKSPKKSAIWIDVEGANQQVLQGGKNTLRKARVVMIEVSDAQFWRGEWGARKVISFMYDLGFTPVARDFEFSGQHNIVFVRNNVLRDDKKVRNNIEYFFSVLTKKTDF